MTEPNEERYKDNNMKCEDCEGSEENEEAFQLPISFLEEKIVLEEHTINDLELLPNADRPSLYKHVFNPTTIFGEKNIPLWSKYYTADTVFLQESQKLL